ncbi:MAG: cyclodeaminase/cyclohydrolase family protein [Chitinophagales bacterium]|nr:cyclodeaminase/cyclohydrolase family protein [Chitinophagales bacterium]
MAYKLFEFPAQEMFDELGKGKGMPGSGCVSLISAISGLQLLTSVCKLTLEKKKYEAIHDQLQSIAANIEEEYLPKLNRLCNDDIEIVKEMFRLRNLRDNESDEEKKAEYTVQALAQLRKGTESVADICGTCLDIIPSALFVYDKGLATAKGDSAVVISNLLAAVAGALYMTLFNIKSSDGSEWVDDIRTEIETYFGRLHEYQYIFSGKLAGLYNKTWQ